MTDLNKTIEYIFNIKDNVSSTAGQMAERLDELDEQIQIHEQTQADMTERSRRNLDELDDATDQSKQGQIDLRGEMDRTQNKSKETQLDFLTQLTSVMALKEGVGAVTGGIVALGLVSEDTAKDLMKVNAGFQLFAGVVQTLQAVKGIMTTLNLANAVGAVIDTYRAALQNPIALAGIGMATGAAVGVAGAYLMNQGGSTVNNTTTNITVMDTTPQQATSQIYRVVEGGAL